MIKKSYHIYCDGASRKDGRGGWGYVVLQGQVVLREARGGFYNTTNNRMELTAAIRAVQDAPRDGIVTIHSDSQYVVQGILEHMDLWLRTNWRTSGNKPVKNQDLWEKLGDLDCTYAPNWEWVKGHSGVWGNERADELAGLGIPKERHATKS